MFSRRRIFWIGCLVSLIAPCEAQVNIERLRPEVSTGTTGLIQLDLTLRSGNVDLIEITPAAAIGFSQGAMRWTLLASGDLGWEDGERFANEALAHIRLNRRLRPRLGIEAYGQANYDKARRLDTRYLVGAGFRFCVSGDGVESWFGSSLMAESERHEVLPADFHAADTDDLRWSSYLSVRASISETAGLTGTVYVQPVVSAFDDYRVLANISIDTRIAGKLSLSVSAAVRRDSDPVGGVAETDSRLSTGLGMNW